MIAPVQPDDARDVGILFQQSPGRPGAEKINLGPRILAPECANCRCHHQSIAQRADANDENSVQESGLLHSFTLRSLRALLMTETELKVMAALAIIGLRRRPKTG